MRLEEKERFIEIDIYNDNNQKIGIMEIEPNKKELSRLVIDESYQNQGYGTKAVQMAVEKYGVISLWVRADNPIAIHVYEKNGFKVVDDAMYEMRR